MEPIDVAVEGLHIEELRLCPNCYLVAWNDQSGMRTEQGIPMPKGYLPQSAPKKGEC